MRGGQVGQYVTDRQTVKNQMTPKRECRGGALPLPNPYESVSAGGASPSPTVIFLNLSQKHGSCALRFRIRQAAPKRFASARDVLCCEKNVCIQRRCNVSAVAFFLIHPRLASSSLKQCSDASPVGSTTHTDTSAPCSVNSHTVLSDAMQTHGYASETTTLTAFG